MGYILLGHGDLNLDASAVQGGMEYVAIPQGTTIQFYADTGQGLVYGSDDLDVWSQLNTPWPALDSTNVTYNLTLYSAHELWADELKNSPDFSGHTLLRAGVDLPDPTLLCNGTPETCPTDPRQVATGATHTCSGILGLYSGELFWLACTSVKGPAEAQGVVQDALDGRSGQVIIGQDPDNPNQDWDAPPATN